MLLWFYLFSRLWIYILYESRCQCIYYSSTLQTPSYQNLILNSLVFHRMVLFEVFRSVYSSLKESRKWTCLTTNKHLQWHIYMAFVVSLFQIQTQQHHVYWKSFKVKNKQTKITTTTTTKEKQINELLCFV